VGDAEAIDVESGCFDAVTAGFMIFFCPDPDRVLAEFARVLKPGGVVALSTFDGTTPSAWLRQVEDCRGLGPLTCDQSPSLGGYGFPG